MSSKSKNDLDNIENIISYSNSLEGYAAYIKGNKFELIKLKAQSNMNTNTKIDEKNIYYANVSKNFLLLNKLEKMITLKYIFHLHLL